MIVEMGHKPNGKNDGPKLSRFLSNSITIASLLFIGFVAQAISAKGNIGRRPSFKDYQLIGKIHVTELGMGLVFVPSAYQTPLGLSPQVDKGGHESERPGSQIVRTLYPSIHIKLSKTARTPGKKITTNNHLT
jgi:hypothetical protein